MDFQITKRTTSLFTTHTGSQNGRGLYVQPGKLIDLRPKVTKAPFKQPIKAVSNNSGFIPLKNQFDSSVQNPVILQKNTEIAKSRNFFNLPSKNTSAFSERSKVPTSQIKMIAAMPKYQPTGRITRGPTGGFAYSGNNAP